MTIKIEGLDKLIKDINTIDKNLDDLNVLSKKIGELFTKNIKKTFETKKDPFGNQWTPSKSNPDTLVDTGALKNSIKYKLYDGLIEITGGGAEAPYGIYHNDGIGKMPKRQFMPTDNIPDEWLDDIFEMLDKELSEIIN
jgi:phage gpG-like protein